MRRESPKVTQFLGRRPKLSLFLAVSLLLIVSDYVTLRYSVWQSTSDPDQLSTGHDVRCDVPQPNVAPVLESDPPKIQTTSSPGERSVTNIHAELNQFEEKSMNTKEIVDRSGLVAGEDSFYMDGSALRLLSGSFHYFRTHPAQWNDRLRKMKAAGLNTVSTYIPWNLHEPQKGRYEFDGFFSITKFIQQVQKENLYLIVRPGPYICAEWELGGFPHWLLRDPSMQLRTSKYQPYLNAVEAYLNKLLPIFVPYMYKNGGPIIAFQIENEFGSWSNTGDPTYMKFLRELFIKNGLNKELLFTSDNVFNVWKGQIPGMLATINFNEKPAEQLEGLKNFQPQKPLMVMEYWPGWFDHLGEEHHTKWVDYERSKVHTILAMNASVNFYMFVGGTHFDFWNGASHPESGYVPVTTSYDYDAPISESGDLTPKYHMLKKLFADFKLVSKDLPPVSQEVLREAYGVVTMTHLITYDDLIPLVPSGRQSYKYPRNMENTDINNGNGQGFGWILYRTKVTRSEENITIHHPVQDRAVVLLNGKTMDTLGWSSGMHPVKLPSEMKPEQNIVDILVENMGRVNVYVAMPFQKKGLIGNVSLGKDLLTDWEHISFDFCETFKHNLTISKLWVPYQAGHTQKSPSVYRGYLEVNNIPKDSFLNMEKWERGLVLINGFNLGRYWKGGPQRTLYVPAPVLRKGRNEVIVFELHSSPGSVDFQDKPLLSLESQKN